MYRRQDAVQVITLDKFDIDYRSDGSVGQYRSILTERDLDGRMEQQKEIYVNEPMRFGGVTIYQARPAPTQLACMWGQIAHSSRKGYHGDPGTVPAANRVAAT